MRRRASLAQIRAEDSMAKGEIKSGDPGRVRASMSPKAISPGRRRAEAEGGSENFTGRGPSVFHKARLPLPTLNRVDQNRWGVPAQRRPYAPPPVGPDLRTAIAAGDRGSGPVSGSARACVVRGGSGDRARRRRRLRASRPCQVRGAYWCNRSSTRRTDRAKPRTPVNSCPTSKQTTNRAA